MTDLAKHIVEGMDHEPMENVDPHPKLFSDLEDDDTSENLFTLWQLGIVDAEWDDEESCTRWRLSHFGVELVERGLTRSYIYAMNREAETAVDAPGSLYVDPSEVR